MVLSGIRVFMWLHYLVLYFCVYLGIFIRKTFGDLTTHTHTHTLMEECEKTNKNLVLNFIKASSLPSANWLLVSRLGHWSLCWSEMPLIHFSRNLINLVYSVNRLSIWSAVKALPSLLFLILWAFRWTGRTPQCFLRAALGSGVSCLFLPSLLPRTPFLWFPSTCHVRGQRRSLGWQTPTLDRVDAVRNFMKKISGDLQWQVPFSRSEMAQAQSRAGTCAPSIGPEPLLASPTAVAITSSCSGHLAIIEVNSEWI